jgi:hypothetical protein
MTGKIGCAPDIHPVEEQQVEVNAEVQDAPKRWIKVTATVWAVLQGNPAFLIRCAAMQQPQRFSQTPPDIRQPA